MKERNAFIAKLIVAVGAIIVFAALIFFNFENAITWMMFNNPSQSNWAVVQLTDGEVLYGHLTGVSDTTLGLRDVYLLDKLTQASDTISTSADLGLAPANPEPRQVVAPVSYTDELYITRSSVTYFKFVAPGDPALPYLR